MQLSTHLKLIAGALAIASVLWLAVHNEDRVTIPLTVPVTYDLGENLVRVSGADEVLVKVRATRGRTATLSPADVSVIVSNREGFVGSRLELLDRAVKATFGVEVESVEPPQIAVEYDRIESRGVPVVVRWNGEPAEGWRVDPEQTRAEPARVLVQGPSKLLALLEKVETSPVSVEDLQDAVRVSGLELEPPGSPLTLKEVTKVAAMVPIVPQVGTRNFEQVPIRVVHGEWQVRGPNPGSLDVQIEGPLPSLNKLPMSAIQLTVDVRELEPKTGDYSVEVLRGVDQSLCPGCQVIALKPQRKVDVAVRKRKREPEAASTDGADTTTATAAQQDRSSGEASQPQTSPPADVDGPAEPPGRTG